MCNEHSMNVALWIQCENAMDTNSRAIQMPSISYHRSTNVLSMCYQYAMTLTRCAIQMLSLRCYWYVVHFHMLSPLNRAITTAHYHCAINTFRICYQSAVNKLSMPEIPLSYCLSLCAWRCFLGLASACPVALYDPELYYIYAHVFPDVNAVS